MAKWTFRLWFAFWPLFLGDFLPYVGIFGATRYLNLFWSFIYGLGDLFILSTVGRYPNPLWLLVFGYPIWPILVSGLLYWLSGKFWDKLKPKGRWIAAGLLLLTAVFTISLDRSSKPPFDAIPTLWWMEFVIF